MIYTSGKENNVFNAINVLSHRLNEFYDYCVEQPDDVWDSISIGQSNQIYTLLVSWYYGDNFDGDTVPIIGAFSQIKPESYINAVVRGDNIRYDQPSVKLRSLAFLKNIIEKNELWVWQEQVKKLKYSREKNNNVFNNIIDIKEIEPNKKYMIKCSSNISNDDFNNLSKRMCEFSSNIVLFKSNDS